MSTVQAQASIVGVPVGTGRTAAQFERLGGRKPHLLCFRISARDRLQTAWLSVPTAVTIEQGIGLLLRVSTAEV